MQYSVEKLVGDLLLGQKSVRLEILSTSFTEFLYHKLGELSSRSLGLKEINPLKGLVTIDSPQGLFMDFMVWIFNGEFLNKFHSLFAINQCLLQCDSISFFMIFKFSASH